MEQLASNTKKVLEGKELNPNNKALFDKTLKKAAKPRGSK